MNEAMDSTRLYALNEFNYPKFRSQILHLYLHAFTTGEQAQYIDPQEAESTLDEMMRREPVSSLSRGTDLLVWCWDCRCNTTRISLQIPCPK